MHNFNNKFLNVEEIVILRSINYRKNNINVPVKNESLSIVFAIPKSGVIKFEKGPIM